jgi:hypothetical protein
VLIDEKTDGTHAEEDFLAAGVGRGVKINAVLIEALRVFKVVAFGVGC